MPEKGVVGGPRKNCASPRLERCEDCEPVYHLFTSFTEEDFTPTDFHYKWLSLQKAIQRARSEPDSFIDSEKSFCSYVANFI